jgi:hypothetical protein
VTNAAVRVLLLTTAFALATLVAGWWAVPLVGAAWGALAARGAGSRRPAGRAALAAALAWLLLILWSATTLSGGSRASLRALMTAVGGALQANGAVLVAVTLLFAAALAWSAARLVNGVLKGS